MRIKNRENSQIVHVNRRRGTSTWWVASSFAQLWFVITHEESTSSIRFAASIPPVELTASTPTEDDDRLPGLQQ